MNIKIKATDVTCYVPGDYDQVYQALQKHLESPLKELFSERSPGHDYLQWELQGNDWQCLADSDPITADVVRQELLRQKQLVENRFGQNRQMAQIVLSVPDDNFIFYKMDAEGQLQLRLAAWGYRKPVIIGGGVATGIRGTKRVVEEEPVEAPKPVVTEPPHQEETPAVEDEPVQEEESVQEDQPVVEKEPVQKPLIIEEPPVEEPPSQEPPVHPASVPEVSSPRWQLLLMLLALAALVVGTYFCCKEILS